MLPSERWCTEEQHQEFVTEHRLVNAVPGPGGTSDIRVGMMLPLKRSICVVEGQHPRAGLIQYGTFIATQWDDSMRCLCAPLQRLALGWSEPFMLRFGNDARVDVSCLESRRLTDGIFGDIHPYKHLRVLLRARVLDQACARFW